MSACRHMWQCRQRAPFRQLLGRQYQPHGLQRPVPCRPEPRDSAGWRSSPAGSQGSEMWREKPVGWPSRSSASLGGRSGQLLLRGRRTFASSSSSSANPLMKEFFTLYESGASRRRQDACLSARGAPTRPSSTGNSSMDRADSLPSGVPVDVVLGWHRKPFQSAPPSPRAPGVPGTSSTLTARNFAATTGIAMRPRCIQRRCASQTNVRDSPDMA
mmetsp:Transcript_67242/g.197381  ORF Transcript_67242/g.197381 Transcript_67242/m.197381 type:complete len:215 (-) Transcript_67242:7-651(-)